MPRYDYKCTHCEWTGEVLAHYDHRDNQQCPKCNEPIRRLPHYADLQVMIPARFTQAMMSDYPTSPRTAEERATWDKDGV